MYSVENIAKYVIMKCNNSNIIISNLKLQKILYFIQAEFLVSKNKPCFGEAIEAWDFGPVIPKIYHRYKVYGSSNIPYNESDDDFLFADDDKKLVDGIIEECSKYSASTLVEITHKQAPWKNAYKPFSSAIITNDSIKKYFEGV